MRTINSNLIRNPNTRTPRTPIHIPTVITRPRRTSNIPRNRYLRRHFCRARARVAGRVLSQVREQVSEDGFQRRYGERD